MHTSSENGEVSKEIFVKFLDSDLLNERNFDVIWDNYMKAFGRDKF